MSDPWQAATFDGVEAVRARALARTTPQERFDWLMDALTLAAESGALARARRRKQEWCDRVWAGEQAGPEP